MQRVAAPSAPTGPRGGRAVPHNRGALSIVDGTGGGIAQNAVRVDDLLEHGASAVIPEVDVRGIPPGETLIGSTYLDRRRARLHPEHCIVVTHGHARGRVASRDPALSRRGRGYFFPPTALNSASTPSPFRAPVPSPPPDRAPGGH